MKVSLFSIFHLPYPLVSTCNFSFFLSPEYEVSISGTRVELTCPNQNPEWSFNANKLTGLGRTYVEEIFSEVEHSGFYSCDQNKTLLYLKARVCENCLEVDAMIVATIIIVDICITLGVLFVVYYWSKNKKAKAKPVTRVTGTGGRPRGPNKERPPPVPNPDYEPIRKGQRDLYAGLNHRGV
ncbi:PREDICTED: T-cell surface glycoprotein CD3 epsilon chain [Condylura cristata]|uniref:T-cell surface glycoprotein CD3 epsilon chain n=1 Tax=Condylura cristata TaxID=143302 RepID=UPI00064377A3|nr:PREDICTED: T-cell surface glycoprotein CD3 epsilon chain [Condylura cristata]